MNTWSKRIVDISDEQNAEDNIRTEPLKCLYHNGYLDRPITKILLLCYAFKPLEDFIHTLYFAQIYQANEYRSRVIVVP